MGSVLISLGNALIGRSSSRISLLPMILAYGSLFMLAVAIFVAPCAYYADSAAEYRECSKGMIRDLESVIKEAIG